MTDSLSAEENEDILSVHPEDQAIEADEEVYYDPLDTESGVVAVEPPMVTIARSKHAKEVRRLRQQSGEL